MAHTHDHTHAHDHAHSHVHEEDTYFLDQLSLVALSGAFAVVCLTLYFSQTRMLKLILAPQFHLYILWSGIVLGVMVLVRAITLWQMAGGKAPPPDHTHEAHAHDHAHTHGHHSHDHAGCGHDHEHGDCGHGHDHAHHDHGHHHHGHAHAHAGHDHDHGWAPWRYVVLLVPIMLFLLGIPASAPSVGTQATTVDTSEEGRSAASLVGLGSGGPVTSLAYLPASFGQDDRGPAQNIGIKVLADLALTSAGRSGTDGKLVEVWGQFQPDPRSDQVFGLVRNRIQCCRADVTLVRVQAISRESVSDIRPDAWIKVKGRVDFRPRAGGQGMDTVLEVSSRENIQLTDPDPDPYVQ